MLAPLAPREVILRFSHQLVGTFLALVKVDEKGRVLLSKELRRESGVQKNDRLIAKPLSRGMILLEKPEQQSEAKWRSTGLVIDPPR
jgi:bifunctional DNA-binding transcriptional regulator/antitoxin component of YhaV-PrlF toxin-antitoxin module